MGALQVGVLCSLVHRGFRPSLIVGTSVGALNGAFLAFRPDPQGIDELKRIWLGIQTRDIFPKNPLTMAFHLLARRSHLFATPCIDRLWQQHLPQNDFAAARVPWRRCTLSSACDSGTQERHQPAMKYRTTGLPAGTWKVEPEITSICETVVLGVKSGEAAERATRTTSAATIAAAPNQISTGRTPCLLRCLADSDPPPPPDPPWLLGVRGRSSACACTPGPASDLGRTFLGLTPE